MSSTLPDSILHLRHGPLTSELRQRPGDFGLGMLPEGAQAGSTASSICGFCSTGCQLNLHVQEGGATTLTPHPRYPVNTGMACPKGWEALAVLDSPERGTMPLLRNNGGMVETDWRTAADTFCNRFKKIQKKHGPESVAFLSTGQIATEEMAFLGAFAKFGMRVVHGDGNTRQCMATSVVAYKESFGFDAPPYSYADFEESDVIVLIGANLCIAHPILYQRILRNKRNPEVVVIDPRRTETAQVATRHVAVQPKGDLALLYALAYCMVRDGRIDEDFLEAHTEGFEDFAGFVQAYSPEAVTERTGIPVGEIESLARLISEPGKRVSLWWTMGVNQSHEGVRTAQAIINLALLTGNIGKPGTGANSITGQCNAMGSRLFSNTTNLMGGHDFRNHEHRRKVAEVLEIPEERIPATQGLAYDQIIEGIEQGTIKGLWVIGTNPAHSWIHQNRFRRLREKLEFLVVQDMYHTTETAQTADLFLPAAGWGEKSGTFINSERRIGTIKQARLAPGVALTDFRIVQLLADRWGCGSLFAKWSSPEAVFELLKKLSRGQPCDISGIVDYAMLDLAGGIQWPLAEGTFPHGPERRLFEEGIFFHPGGRARFVWDPSRPLPEIPSEDFPLLLLTGRGSSAQWHTESRTRQSAVLRKLQPEDLLLEIHPQDAAEMAVVDGAGVAVSSVRGDVVAKARITASVQPGQVFLPMHAAGTNALTLDVFDPYSRQPAYKGCAVRVVPLSRWAGEVGGWKGGGVESGLRAFLLQEGEESSCIRVEIAEYEQD